MGTMGLLASCLVMSMLPAFGRSSKVGSDIGARQSGKTYEDAEGKRRPYWVLYCKKWRSEASAQPRDVRSNTPGYARVFKEKQLALEHARELLGDATTGRLRLHVTAASDE